MGCKSLTVDHVLLFGAKGPWKTKSEGVLYVRLESLMLFLETAFFDYSGNREKVPLAMQGLRVYTVSNLSKGKEGGTEFHRIRNEFVAVLQGLFEWSFEDVFGRSRTLIADANTTLYIPSMILHTYKALKDDSSLLVIANTQFNPDKPETHDTYPAEEFKQLQEKYTRCSFCSRKGK